MKPSAVVSSFRDLVGRLSDWDRAACLLLLVGVLFRVALAFPVHKLPAEADSVLTGLTAFEVLRGESPVFFAGYRNGSLGSHLAAVLILLFGASRTALLLGPLLVGTLTMIVWYLFYRLAFDRRIATVALAFVAVPSPAFQFWTYTPNSYPETLLLCAAVLWLSLRAALAPERAARFFALGVAAGLGWWSSPLTLACTAPAGLWLLGVRTRQVLRPRALGWGAAGFALGAAPWLVFNIRYAFPSLRSSFATRSVDGLDALLDNADYLLSYKLPALVAGADPRYRPRVADSFQWMERPLLVLHLVAVVVFVGWAVRNWLRPISGRDELHRAAPWLLLLVVASTVALNLGSGAGSIRGATVRYVLPIYLAVPGFVAVLAHLVARRSRSLALATAAFVLFSHVVAAFLPWTEDRARQAWNAEQDDLLLEELERREVQVVAGSYWTVYPLTYFSRERILGVPLQESHDHERLALRLGPEAKRWALLAAGGHRRAMRQWLETSGIEGELVALPTGHLLFLVDGQRPGRVFLHRIRSLSRGGAWGLSAGGVLTTPPDRD